MRLDTWRCGDFAYHDGHDHVPEDDPDGALHHCPGYRRLPSEATRAATQTDDGAATPGQSSGGSSPGSVPEASEVVSGPAPSSPLPRTFLLWRHVDISGVSGTGPVAEGCQFVDGSVALRWRGDNPATAVWPDLDSMLAVHGHQGATEIQWIDDTPIPLWPAEGGLQ